MVVRRFATRTRPVAARVVVGRATDAVAMSQTDVLEKAAEFNQLVREFLQSNKTSHQQ